MVFLSVGMQRNLVQLLFLRIMFSGNVIICCASCYMNSAANCLSLNLGAVVLELPFFMWLSGWGIIGREKFG